MSCLFFEKTNEPDLKKRWSTPTGVCRRRTGLRRTPRIRAMEWCLVRVMLPTPNRWTWQDVCWFICQGLGDKPQLFLTCLRPFRTFLGVKDLHLVSTTKGTDVARLLPFGLPRSLRCPPRRGGSGGEETQEPAWARHGVACRVRSYCVNSFSK